MTSSRALQILNNVTEEYVDQGETDFATPKEFCEAILYLLKREMKLNHAHIELKHRLLSFALTQQKP